MRPIKSLINIGLLDPTEPPGVQRLARIFDFIMFLVMIWLPVQWYLESRNELPDLFVIISDWIIWGFFFTETAVMVTLVRRKGYYLLSNWLNLIIIIALFPPLWIESSKYAAALRYIRFFVFFRLLLPQLKIIQKVLTRNHFGATLGVLLVVTLLSGIIVTIIDPKMGSVWHGIWWAVQTVTTVGYGDIIPDGAIGKIFGVVLMILGVGLYSLVSANLAAYFVERGRRQVEKKPQKKVQRGFLEIQEKLDKLDKSNRKLINLLEKKSDLDDSTNK